MTEKRFTGGLTCNKVQTTFWCSISGLQVKYSKACTDREGKIYPSIPSLHLGNLMILPAFWKQLEKPMRKEFCSYL